ncbi:hypothetical protein BS756_00710 [Staphylococcus sp. MB371]|nr:hypothetical protein BS756_00710 [Staphylococcus sp. MB371]
MAKSERPIKNGYDHYINEEVTIYFKEEEQLSDTTPKRKVVKGKLLYSYPYEIIVERNNVKTKQGNPIDQHLIIPKHSISYLKKIK